VLVGKSIVVTWDVASGDVLHIFENYVNLPMALAFSPTGSFLVCTDAGGECSEFCLTGALFITRNIRREGAPETEMRAVVWEPESNRYICGHDDGSVITVDSAGNTLQLDADLNAESLSYTEYSSRGDGVCALAMSMDGLLLAVAGGRLIHECGGESPGKPRVSGFVSVYQSSIISANTGASRERHTSLLWKYCAIPEHNGSVFSVSFSLDGKLLASGGVDRLCRVWNSMDGTIVNQINLSHVITDLFFVFDIEEQRKRRVAFAMGGHKSLGIDSILSILPEDLMNTLIASI
jgi:WD40 repeat protein